MKFSVFLWVFFCNINTTVSTNSSFEYLNDRVEYQGLRVESKFSKKLSDAIVGGPILENLPKGLKIKYRALASNWTLQFSINYRKNFLCDGVNKVSQGSYKVDLPLGLLSYLSKVQYSLGIKGSIGEIGVHGGLFFIGLAHLAFQDEKLWACDVFEQQHKNVDGSGNGDKKSFLQQCKIYGINENELKLYEGSSAELSNTFTKEIGIAPFRLFSVDGGHTRQLTINDLTIAAENLTPGGIIILDDVTNMYAWPGVIDGMFTWLALYPHDYGIFFVGYNKVLITQKKYHSIYYHALLKDQQWKNILSDDPESNKNPHKHKNSGKNRFAWGGYAYVRLIESLPNFDPKITWANEIGLKC
jgi:hypothetical protein